MIMLVTPFKSESNIRAFVNNQRTVLTRLTDAGSAQIVPAAPIVAAAAAAAVAAPSAANH